MPLDLEPRHHAMVLDILQRRVPERSVWAYGSRATGRHLKRFSDLDLAVEGRLPPGVWMTLVDDFDESLLPIKVDVVETARLDPSFRKRIEKDFVVVQEPVASNFTEAQAEASAGL